MWTLGRNDCDSSNISDDDMDDLEVLLLQYVFVSSSCQTWKVILIYVLNV